MLYARARDVARSPEGRELLAYVQRAARDPRNRERLRLRVARPRKGSIGRRMTDSAAHSTNAPTARSSSARPEVTGLIQPAGESREESQAVSVLCVIGPNWLVTVHDAPVAFLEDFRERVEGGSDLGDLDAVAFLATLLHWQLTSYDEEIRRIIATLDDLEDQALRDSASHQETLEQLVSLRRRISRLRALLAPHEPLFAQLARPESTGSPTSDSAEAFRTLADRAAASVATVEGAREISSAHLRSS